VAIGPSVRGRSSWVRLPSVATVAGYWSLAVWEFGLALLGDLDHVAGDLSFLGLSVAGEVTLDGAVAALHAAACR